MSRKGENIIKRNDGRWEARVKVGYNSKGKAKYHSIYAKTYSEVKLKKEEYLMTFKEKTYDRIYESGIFGDILREYLLHVRTGIKQSSFVRYKNIVEQYLTPALGGFKTSDIDEQIYDKFIYENVKSESKNGELSSKRMRDIVSVLNQAVAYAQSQGYQIASGRFLISKNSKKTIDILSTNDENKLVSYVMRLNDLSSLSVLISLYTGMRIGEICALKWRDFDFSNRTVHINKTLQRLPKISGEKGTEIVIDKPKTESSQRYIPVPDFLISYIENRRANRSAEDYVLTDSKKYIEPSNLYVKYQTWLKGAEMTHHSFHCLRHTFATRCVELGVDPKTLSEILGHSNVSTTLSLYVHPSLEHKRENINKLSKTLSSQILCQKPNV